MTILLLWWLAVGLDLPWEKLQLGRSVNWIGAQVTIRRDEAQVALPEEFLESMKQHAIEMLQKPSIPVQDLRQYGGKGVWSGSIIPGLGIMISPLWSALAA